MNNLKTAHRYSTNGDSTDPRYTQGSHRTSLLIVTVICSGSMIGGCVERTLTVRSEPPGAVVIVNDEEIGASPAKFSFVWYGDYEIILRKPGYETVNTFHRVPAPWYQFPPFDFVAEILVPGTIRDVRETPVYVLAPRTEPSVPELIENAEKTRGEAGNPTK